MPTSTRLKISAKKLISVEDINLFTEFHTPTNAFFNIIKY